MDAHRGDFKFRIQGAARSDFDVLHMMFNGVPRDPHIAPGEAIEHKGVVRIRTMGKRHTLSEVEVPCPMSRP